jgi:hypothetical protein
MDSHFSSADKKGKESILLQITEAYYKKELRRPFIFVGVILLLFISSLIGLTLTVIYK